MDKRDKAWYVDDRADLLARLFLEDLGAAVWTAQEDKTNPFNALATFSAAGEKSRIVAVKVRATEQPVADEFRFAVRLRSLRALQLSNVPVLFLVVDVKHNQVYFGWARDVRLGSQHGKRDPIVQCTLPVTAAPEHKQQLLEAILSQPDLAVAT